MRSQVSQISHSDLDLLYSTENELIAALKEKQREYIEFHLALSLKMMQFQCEITTPN